LFPLAGHRQVQVVEFFEHGADGTVLFFGYQAVFALLGGPRVDRQGLEPDDCYFDWFAFDHFSPRFPAPSRAARCLRSVLNSGIAAFRGSFLLAWLFTQRPILPSDTACSVRSLQV
jgi:hypothetical protein